MSSRRRFLAGLGAAAVGSLAPVNALARLSEALAPALYPPIDLSYFDTPVSPAPADVKFGYAAITWGGHDLQAIDDIAAVGFPGIQLRSNILKEFGDRPAALREILAKHRLTMVALSSGGVIIDPAVEARVLDEHTRNARFVHEVGGLYLQVTDQRPKDRAPGNIDAADMRRLGRLLTEIGKRTADLGVPLGYHNHMGTLGETPEAVDRILDAADPRYVKLELDVAHYHQGGGDPARAIRQYADRLLFLHLKDVESPSGAGRAGGAGEAGLAERSYRFVELGRGKVDLPAVFKALRDVKFRGWAVVELDSVPDNARTPKESAVLATQYLKEHGYLHTVGSH
jgi:inosose dehydratase